MSKFTNALKLSWAVSSVLKFFNFEATSFPGKIVQKYYPDFLKECNKCVLGPRFAITGTNGKTTTSTLLAEILKAQGLKIINNKTGANMPNGIVTALSCGLYKRKEVSGVVLECDEAYFSHIANKFAFDYLLVTNLFRDQLDRYGEMDIAREKIIKGIELNPDIKIVLNADDPALFDMVEKLNYNADKFVFFGINSICYSGYEKTSKSPKESLYCPKCKENIKYNEHYFAQLGDWYCTCGLSRPKLLISADVTVYPDKNVLNIKYKDASYTITTNLTGLYNAYNVLGAISLALMQNIPFEVIERGIQEYSPVFGRHQKVKLKNGGTLTIHLIKNPVGASEVLRGLKNLKNSKMLISINDNYADGRDVSWLWDADFEALSDFSDTIFTTGTRSFDMALRMKHAGFDTKKLVTFDNTDKVAKNLEKVIKKLQEDENLTVLVTYTGLLDINKNLKKIIKKQGV